MLKGWKETGQKKEEATKQEGGLGPGSSPGLAPPSVRGRVPKEGTAKAVTCGGESLGDVHTEGQPPRRETAWLEAHVAKGSTADRHTVCAESERAGETGPLEPFAAHDRASENKT